MPSFVMFGIFLRVPVPGIKRLQKSLLAASAIEAHSCPMLLPEGLKWGRKIILGGAEDASSTTQLWGLMSKMLDVVSSVL